MSDELLKEIDDIDKKALDMAILVLESPILRDRFTGTAHLLLERLNEIANDLKNGDQQIYQQKSDQISESLLDLSFVLREHDVVSFRLAQAIEADKLRKQSSQSGFDTHLPLPTDVRQFTKTLKSDQINYQTGLSLEQITEFYRRVFAGQGLVENALLTSTSAQHLSLVFEGLPEDRVIIVQSVDLAYGTMQDIRNVNVRTEILRSSQETE